MVWGAFCWTVIFLSFSGKKTHNCLLYLYFSSFFLFVNYYFLMINHFPCSRIKPLHTCLSLFGHLCSFCHYLSEIYAFRLNPSISFLEALAISSLLCFSPSVPLLDSRSVQGELAWVASPTEGGVSQKTRLAIHLFPSPSPT